MRTKLWVGFVAAVLVLSAAIYLVPADEKVAKGEGEPAGSPEGRSAKSEGDPVASQDSKPAKGEADAAKAAKPQPIPPDPAPIEPASHCSNCPSSFCSRYGVRCTWTGECCSGQGSAHKNCEYTCACDATCTTVTSPSNVCITDPGPSCCVLCQTEWCKFEDLKCTATCTGGCCTYSNCVEAACSAQPCPPNACPGTCS